MGKFAHTSDGTTNTEAPDVGKPFFPDPSNKRELLQVQRSHTPPIFESASRKTLARSTQVGGSEPPVTYHSLVVERGARHYPEYVLFHGENVYVG